MADWASLPEMVLAKVFSYLPTYDRVYMGNVCTTWEDAACRPEVWEIFTFSEEYLFLSLGVDYFSGDNHQITLDNVEGNVLKDIILSVIKNVGRYFKKVNIYYRSQSSNEIMSSIASYCTNIKALKVQRLKTNVQVVRNYESSCKQSVWSIIQRNTKLSTIDLRDIDGYSINNQKKLLPISAAHSVCLTHLYLLQTFQECQLGSLMYLVHLEELALGPHLLSYSLLHHLAGRSLRRLHIVALDMHAEFYNENLQNWQWAEIKKQGPQLRVHCHFGVGHEWTEREIILKREMPLESLVYSKYTPLVYRNLTDLICSYSNSLVEFIDYSFSYTSYEVDRSANYRKSVNKDLFQIVDHCKHLKTLAVKETLYSGVILVMAFKNKNLQVLLMENQVEYGFAFSHLELNISSNDVDKILQACSTPCTFQNEFLVITERPWKFYLQHELFDVLFRNHLKFI